MSRQLTRRSFWSLALVLTALAASPVDARQRIEPAQEEPPFVQRRIPEGRRNALPFVRTELFFGTAKPRGVVTEEEFRQFVDEEVTKRFPDGLTILKGEGQFRGDDNVIVKEQSFILILMYPLENQKKCAQKIQLIRELYKQRFRQQSVMRVDKPFVVSASF
jgi:hypothetical protein